MYQLINLGNGTLSQFELWDVEEGEPVATSKNLLGMSKHILEEMPDLAENIANHGPNADDIALVDFSPSLEEEFYGTMSSQFTMANIDGLIDFQE